MTNNMNKKIVEIEEIVSLSILKNLGKKRITIYINKNIVKKYIKA